MPLGLLDPDPGSLVKGMDPDSASDPDPALALASDPDPALDKDPDPSLFS